MKNQFNLIQGYVSRALLCLCMLLQFFVTVPVRSVQAAQVEAELGGCNLFPADNIWNARVDSLPVHARSTDWVNSIGRSTGFHMDFGSGTWDGGPIGIPYNIVDGNVSKVSVSFYYPDESDAGPYPIPASPLREWGSDHHILIVDSSTCMLYEIYDASYTAGHWNAGSGAIWNLNSNALRPDTWTSADAAGLPMLPGLVRYDEIVSGKIEHALRFTASQTNKYIWPARHLTSNDATPQIPPMGARFRLKSDFNISGFSPKMQIILRAMQQYGIILADNGADWYVSGSPDPRWDNDMLHTLDVLSGDDFEAVDTALIKIGNNSGAVKVPSVTITGNAGTAGVTLSYTDGTAKTVTSDGSGNYVINVPVSWSGKVVPSKAGVLSFSPASRTYTGLVSGQTRQHYHPNMLLAVTSNAVEDGYIRETSENSGVGGISNPTSDLIVVGDDSLKRQYRGLLSFNSGALPDNAVIVSAVVKLTKQFISAVDPFISLGKLGLDIRKPVFGSSAQLVPADFSAEAGLLNAGWVRPVPVGAVYSGALTAPAFKHINLTGMTQIRVRFTLDDNNNLLVDKLVFYSADSSNLAYRPVLNIVYYIP